MSDQPVSYFTPDELCRRWRIDRRTLDKLPLARLQLTVRIRRYEVRTVLAFEQAQHLVETT